MSAPPSSPPRSIRRSQVPLRPTPVSGALSQELSRPPSPLRASRLVTDPLAREAPPVATPFTTAGSASFAFPSAPSPSSVSGGMMRPLMPGTLLRGGRYRLQELQGRQEWVGGVSETSWSGQDAQRAGARVMICELVIPERASLVVQTMLRTATMALSAIGRHAHVPALLDAFSDQGRHFFVFEAVEGENLLARLRRSGRALPEREVIDCCLQMCDVLEVLGQQTPPLVHGLIRPEHIVLNQAGSQYVLTNFSIILAGGATQFVSGMERVHLSPYLPPEFARGFIDGRTDLYSLVATAYHLVTGSPPSNVGGSVPLARRVNPQVSAEFETILAKGLRPMPGQRYQRPADLRQDLLALRSTVTAVAVSGLQRSDEPLLSMPLYPAAQRSLAPSATTDSVAQELPRMLGAVLEEEEQRLLLPRPEDLPPMRESNDMRNAALWITCILVVLIAVVVFARGAF